MRALTITSPHAVIILCLFLAGAVLAIPEQVTVDEVVPEDSPLQQQIQTNKKGIQEIVDNRLKCHVMYAMADNNLDGAISQDVEELISNTDAIEKSNFYPLIFIDRHYTGKPIKGLKAKNGQDDAAFHSGVRYIEKNFEKKQIQVSEEYGELDSDDQKTMTDFLTWAFKRCKARDAKAKVIFTLGSHGYGWKGFGGDEAVLLQEEAIRNQGIKTAIMDSMKAVGDPKFTKLDLLGFDACSMMSYSALYSYKGLFKYYLGSEALEPGHGWNYSKIDYSTSVRKIAIQFADTFIEHSVSDKAIKTLAMVSNVQFVEFSQAMDSLAIELKSWLEAADTATAWSRKDMIGQAWTKAARPHLDQTVKGDRVDVGDFLQKMAAEDTASDTLKAAISKAQQQYSLMLSQCGKKKLNCGHFAYKSPTTVLTGMFIFFPFNEGHGDYTSWMEGTGGYAAAKERPWNQFLSVLHATLKPCTGRSAYKSPFDAQYRCNTFKKGVVTTTPKGNKYEFYKYCTQDKADDHCSECDKCTKPTCVGRDSYRGYKNAECSEYKKGGSNHKYCTEDKADDHCSECEVCADKH